VLMQLPFELTAVSYITFHFHHTKRQCAAVCFSTDNVTWRLLLHVCSAAVRQAAAFCMWASSICRERPHISWD
jgi:hypothetical protein